MLKSVSIVTFIFIIAISVHLSAQDKKSCGIKNTSFKDGEKITYVISYTWSFLWTDVGEAEFTVKRDKKFGKDVLHLHSFGKTYHFYDWFFKVRDLYESWVDPVTLQPVYFNRDIYEGGFTKQNEYTFNWNQDKIYTRIKRKKGPNKYDTLKIEKCTYDVVSAIYIARNLDFAQIKPNKIFPVTVVLDREIYHVGYKFLGKEKKNIKGLGKYNCLKFQVDLVVGDVFSGNQKLYVWVTDDQNKVPISIESPIKVGSIKARVIKWEGLRYKSTSSNN